MRKFIKDNLGLLASTLYAVLMRLIFEINDFSGFELSGLFSATFLWIVPSTIGIIPMIFASEVQLSSNFYRITRPVISLFLFFVIVLSTGIEDLICILILSIPFLLAAGVAGYAFSGFIKNRNIKRGRMYSLLLLPIITGVIEEKLQTSSHRYEVTTEAIVYADPKTIWTNIIRVDTIQTHEYRNGFFNYAGIPRPLFAELDGDTIGAIRTGHFEGGLIFREVVTDWHPNEKVAFDITVIPSSIRRTVFDQHVLNGKHFTFLNASYELETIASNVTRLRLSSTYQLDTKINRYSSLWGETLLSDFQERLLAVIKNRCERQAPSDTTK